jgi:hypothetical protein
MTTNSMEKDLPNGPVAAALVAGGFGSMILGLVTILATLSAPIKTALTWNVPVGALSGKVGVGVIAFFGSWIVLHFLWRGKNVNFNRAATAAFVLLALSLLFTFPPFFDLFAPK